MKNKSTRKIANWFKDVGLKSFAILLLVAAGFYTYAQVAFPTDSPNPVSGVVGQFVGESTNPYTGSAGYATANKLCADSPDPNINGSHICTPDEMENSYNHGTPASPITSYTNPPSNTLWINGGPPGFTANANDCQGWIETTNPIDNPNYGVVWDFALERGEVRPCDIPAKKFACCK